MKIHEIRGIGLAAALAISAATAAPPAPPQSAANGQEAAFTIVSPDWVAAHADDAGVRILDVRTSVADYQHGHVPNAVFLANDSLRAPSGGVPVQYLDPEEMASLFQRAGVDPDDHVVVYADGADVLGATMTAYALHRIGHPTVSVMDGGIAAYRQRFPLTQAYPDAPRGAIAPTLNDTVLVTLDTLKTLMGREGVTILDTRPATDYLGNTSRWTRNGHIPGALNLDWHTIMDPANPHAFRPVAEMKRLVEAAGVRPSDDIVVYCGTSREATLVYQVLRNVLGYPRVRLYEGSWTEYATTDLPVERAPAGMAAAHAPPTTDRLEPYACGNVARLHTINNIFLASQPSPADFEQASKGGIRTVINQRHPSEVTDFDEAEVVRALGMTYHNPAWNGPDELTDEVLDRTIELLRTAERPVLLHCSSANRTGATWLAYSVLERGLSWEDALAEAHTVGLRSPDYERIVRDYVSKRR